MVLAESGKRLVARIIDFVILVVAYLVVNIGIVFGLADTSSSASGFNIGLNLTAFLVGVGFWIVYWLYESLMAAGSGKTVGKMIMKVRIVDVRGGEVTTAAGMKRSLVWLVPLVPCCIGFLAFLVIEIWGLVNLFNDPMRQTLMDKFAETVVVDA